MLQRPRILILDEATSCLDLESEALILRNLQNHLPASTLIVVTHRTSALTTLDRVLVLSHGRIFSDFSPSALISGQTLPSSSVRTIPAGVGELACDDPFTPTDNGVGEYSEIIEISRQLSKSERG